MLIGNLPSRWTALFELLLVKISRGQVFQLADCAIFVHDVGKEFIQSPAWRLRGVVESGTNLGKTCVDDVFNLRPRQLERFQLYDTLAAKPQPDFGDPALAVFVITQPIKGVVVALVLAWAGSADGDKEKRAVAIGREFRFMDAGLVVGKERQEAQVADLVVQQLPHGELEGALGRGFSFGHIRQRRGC